MAVIPMPWKLISDLFRLLGRLLAHKENNIYNSAHAHATKVSAHLRQWPISTTGWPTIKIIFIYILEKFKKKSETVLVELPRDIMNSPDVVSMLDRTGTSSRKAVGVVSSILKTATIGGQQVDLSEYSL